MGKNRERVVQCSAEIESTEGTNPGFDHSADGFKVFRNGRVVSDDIASVNLDELSEAYTEGPDAPGRALSRFQPVILVQGSGAAATPVRFNDILRACALAETVAASSVVYKPRSNSLETCTVMVNEDGIVREINGCKGSFQMSGQAGQPVELSFDLVGTYNDPVNEGSGDGDFSTYDNGTNYVQTLKAANFIVDNGTVAWNSSNPAANPLRVRSFQFNPGVNLGELPDANATDGYQGQEVESKTGTVQIVVEAKDTLTGLPTIFADRNAATLVPYALSWQIGTGTGKIWTVSVPKAQLKNITEGSGPGGITTWTLDFKIQHDTADEEFVITTK